MAKIGIVTVLYNSSSVLDDFFESLSHQSYKDFVLYCVDNASTDDSVCKTKLLTEKYSFPVVILAQKTNYGVAKGNNIGIVEALDDGSEYVLLANNDIVLHEDAIHLLLTGMLDMKSRLAVPKIFFFKPSNLIWAAGGVFDKIKGATIQYGLLEEDKRKYSVNRLVSYAPTCFMLVDKQVFLDYGLMDERYFVYYDDTDFIWRVVIKGKEKLAYIASSVIWHKVSTLTTGAGSGFSFHYLNRNSIYFVFKNYSLLLRSLFLLYKLIHYVTLDMKRMNMSQRKTMRSYWREGYMLYKEFRAEQAC